MMNERINGTHQPMRILIVDALDHTRESLRVFLQLHDGMEVVGEAANAAETLNLTQTLQPDIIIMDVHLTNRTGFEVTRDLRTLLTPPLAVILLTVHLAENDVQQAIASGAVTCIEKSAGVDPIIATIHSIISNHVQGEAS